MASAGSQHKEGEWYTVPSRGHRERSGYHGPKPKKGEVTRDKELNQMEKLHRNALANGKVLLIRETSGSSFGDEEVTFYFAKKEEVEDAFAREEESKREKKKRSKRKTVSFAASEVKNCENPGEEQTEKTRGAGSETSSAKHTAKPKEEPKRNPEEGVVEDASKEVECMTKFVAVPQVTKARKSFKISITSKSGMQSFLYDVSDIEMRGEYYFMKKPPYAA